MVGDRQGERKKKKKKKKNPQKKKKKKKKKKKSKHQQQEENKQKTGLSGAWEEIRDERFEQQDRRNHPLLQIAAETLS